MPDLRTLLAHDELERLRGGYDAAAMNEGARRATSAPYPPVGPLVDALIDGLYGDKAVLPGARREQLLLALLASRAASPRILAVHLYWGLMEGLTLDEVGATLMLVGAYEGIDRFSEATRHLGTLVDKVLRPALASGGEALGSRAILGAVAAAF